MKENLEKPEVRLLRFLSFFYPRKLLRNGCSEKSCIHLYTKEVEIIHYRDDLNFINLGKIPLSKTNQNINKNPFIKFISNPDCIQSEYS